MPNKRWILKILVAALILSAVMVTRAGYAAEDVFTVSGVTVDIKAENAVAAREKAFPAAQVSAFRALAEQFRGEAQMPSYTAPPVDVISTMIHDFEITDERVSAVRYIGTYTFRFDGNAVRNHFNIPAPQQEPMAYDPYANQNSSQMAGGSGSVEPVLVLPFFKQGANTVLWQDPNPWLQAWSRQNHMAGPNPVVAPIGDIPDVADIGDDEALNYNTVNLVNMLSRYKASEAVILIATPGPMGSAGVPSDLQVMMYRTDHAVPEFSQMVNVVPDMNSSAANLYDKAVREVKAAMRGGWRPRPAQSNVAATNAYPTLPGLGGGASAQAIELRLSFATMQQWIETRQALRRVQGVSEMKIKSVTPRDARVEVQFNGDENRLRMMMAQADIVVGARQGSGFQYGGGLTAYPAYLRKYPPSFQ